MNHSPGRDPLSAPEVHSGRHAQPGAHGEHAEGLQPPEHVHPEQNAAVPARDPVLPAEPGYPEHPELPARGNARCS